MRPKARLTALMTGRHRVASVGAVTAHERTVLAVTRSIHKLTAERTLLRKRAAEVARELRHKRRELRALLQRDSSFTEDSAVAEAGHSDAIDAQNHRSEARLSVSSVEVSQEPDPRD